jgi:hypothetical protein
MTSPLLRLAPIYGRQNVWGVEADGGYLNRCVMSWTSLLVRSLPSVV